MRSFQVASRLCGLLALSFSFFFPTSHLVAFNVQWAHQLGTASNDSTWFEAGNAIDTDGLGNAYFAGQTDGSLGGPSAGASDLFFGKYDSSGNLQWTRQLGTIGQENSHGIAADSLGNVFVTGWTQGSLGGPNAGSTDAFLAKYDGAGNQQWVRQVGTTGDDRAFSIVDDNLGNVYFAGWTFGALAGPLNGVINAFVYKYDAVGNQIWGRQSSIAAVSFGQAVAVDTLGNVFLSGTSFGDAFVSKYDASGNFQWNAFLAGTQFEDATAMVTDGAGNLYLTGYTLSNLSGPNAGNADAILAKYNPSGVLQWVQQFGSIGADYGHGIDIVPNGNILVSGSTTESLFGTNPAPGSGDLYLAEFNSNGALLNSMQWPASGDEANSSISVDTAGDVYLAGFTTSLFVEQHYGGFDVFVLKIPVPEPSFALLVVGGSVALLRRRRV